MLENEIEIREMTIEDIDQALDLWKKSFNAGFSSGFDTYEIIEKYLIRNKGFSTVACLADKTLIGALMCGHDGRRGSIYHTAVHTQYRRKSIGKIMEQRSLDLLRQIGITSGFLFINVKNPGSKEFWTNIGWEVIEDVKYLYKEF